MNVHQLLDLNGKVALVTGGSRGIGRTMAEALGEAGARIAISARKPAELEAARAHFDGLGIACFTVGNDLSVFASIPGLVDSVLGHYGQIDILVNNAGCSWGAPAEDYPDDGWHKVMNLDVTSQFFLSREVGRRSMIPRRTGKIINVASIAGFGGNPPAWGMNTVAYNTAKGALITLTRTLAMEWGKYNIQSNAICPGFFLTKMTAVMLDAMDEQYRARTAAGRLGNLDDLKGLTLLLASAGSDYLTGQSIAVDGGFTAG